MIKEIILTILEAVLSFAITIGTIYFVAFLKKKSQQLSDMTDNENAKHYLSEITEAVTTAVIFTSQTYVDALKNKNAFTKDAQIEALNKAKETALSIISPAATDFIEEVYGDLDVFMEAKIEEAVRVQKTESAPVQTINVAVAPETKDDGDK